MSFNRKMKRRDREQSARMPKADGADADALRERLNGVGKLIEERLPGRPFVLLSAPVGTQAIDIQHVATLTNMPREVAARLFEGMIDWWRPSGIVVQPDHSVVQMLRESVHIMRDVDLATVTGNLKGRGAELAAAIAADDIKAIGEKALLMATESLAVLDAIAPRIAKQPAGVPGPEMPHRPRDWPKGDTKTTLVADLERYPPSRVRDRLIKEAKAGRFHDFDSEEAGPKLLLYANLHQAGFEDLAIKTREGAYDDERPTVEQAEEMRAELGPKLWDAMMSDGPDKRGKA